VSKTSRVVCATRAYVETYKRGGENEFISRDSEIHFFLLILEKNIIVALVALITYIIALQNYRVSIFFLLKKMLLRRKTSFVIVFLGDLPVRHRKRTPLMY
jgi:hypothetical protein